MRLFYSGSVLLLYCLTVLFLVYKLGNDRNGLSQNDERSMKYGQRTCPPGNATKAEKPIRVLENGPQFGPGANGDPLILDWNKLSESEKASRNESWEKYDYDAFVSDKIPVNRRIRDFRPDACKQLTYPDTLLSVSVVIPFRNERLSVLLRTVYSILQTSPEHMLEEIILVDDASTVDDTKYMLDIHVGSIPKLKLIRKDTNVGLMMARQAGIDAASAEYFICLDSHMECSPGWLEPILYRLIQQPKSLLTSVMMGINSDTFGIKHIQKYDTVLDFPFFAWNLEQEHARYRPEYVKSVTNMTEPRPMGTVMGMMICMKKSWFLQIGGFDPGMKIWGSEQIELSIRVWTCGGRVEMVPCSNVGHVYRKVVWKVGEMGFRNKYRLTKVWMDEYQQIVYDYNNMKPDHVDIGDVADRVKVREDNKCKPFKYFLDTVKEFAVIHVPVAEFVFKMGALQNIGSDKCLERIGLVQYQCHYKGSMQLYEYTKNKELRHLAHCIIPTSDGSNIMFRYCDHFHIVKDKQWQYDDSDQTLRYLPNGKCLTADGTANQGKIFVDVCTDSPFQKWKWADIKR